MAGEPVTLTATVSGTGATGMVAFKDWHTTIGAAPLSGGTATFSTSSLSLGWHTIYAVYAGDANFAPSTSPSHAHQVRTASTTTLTSAPNPSDIGTSVTLTATVTGSGATGEVTFYDGATTLGTAALSGGTASISRTFLDVGFHELTATYSGDATYGASTSPVHMHSVRPPFGTPSGLTATPTAPNEVTVTWNGVSGATEYEVARGTNTTNFETIGSVTGTSFNDTTVSSNTTYLYIVRAIGSSGASDYSSLDAATTVVFTNDPLTPGVPVFAVHVTQLRVAVSAMRSAAGLPPAAFTDHVLPAGSPIKALHIQQLRDALSAARSALGLPPLALTDPTLTPGATPLKAAHLQELRDGCK